MLGRELAHEGDALYVLHQLNLHTARAQEGRFANERFVLAHDNAWNSGTAESPHWALEQGTERYKKCARALWHVLPCHL
jgi:hypothetical protein